MIASTIAPVRRSVTVGCSPDEAFRIFTEQVGAWWPVEPHSVGQDRVATVIIEAGVGGRMFERWDDGTEHDWGEILIWDPPSRFAMTWHPGSKHVTEVEVRFSTREEGTLVELEHRNWERIGEDGPRLRASYDQGWPLVLQRLVEATG